MLQLIVKFNLDLLVIASRVLYLYVNNIQVRIAIVGKYTGLSDSYLSILKVHLITITFSWMNNIFAAANFTFPYTRVFVILETIFS